MRNSSSKYSFNPNRQLFYGIALVIIVPLLVVLNSLVLVRQFNEILTREQHRQAILIGQITESLISEKIDDPNSLQSLIQETVLNNSELTDLIISKPTEDGLVIWASTNRSRIGVVEENTAAVVAIKNKRSVAQRVAEGTKQYWEIQYPVTNATQEVVALITMHLSTATIDSESGNLIFQSFMMLALIVLVIILLLASNTRLFQYTILYKRLQEIDKAKDDFISIASHELRTPITAMRNYFSLLLDGTFGKLSKKTKESVIMMNENALRLSNLVEDLLNVSRLQQGRISITPEEFDVVPLVRDVIASLQSTAQEKCLELCFDGEKGPFIVIADPVRLRQVLVNIIGNGLKYTNKGSVKTSVESDNRRVIIKIKDTGIGISAEDQHRLFEKFYRVINRKTQNIIGTGLGLWLSREMLMLMSGKVFIESIENVGTQVSISLPLGKKDLDKGSR